MEEKNEKMFGRPIEDVLNGFLLSPFFANALESEEAYLLELSVPGFKPEDLSIRFEPGTLVVTAEKKELDKGDLAMGRLEFQRQYYERRFVLPKDADPMHFQASLENGVLRFHFTKRRLPGDRGPRNIPIQ